MTTKTNVFQRNYFHVNMKSLVRRETLEGREHIAAPMTMITEGVHAGSGGPVYYPGSELEKSAPIWNHKPVVVYHPKKNGSPVSACSPEILEDYKVGLILNSAWDTLQNRLRSEAWGEESRYQKVDSRVLDAINNNETMEVSTGMFMDLEETEGTWNGEKYVAIARNIRPDHLAILPDVEGACSRKDGAGLLVNSAAFEKEAEKRWEVGFLKALVAQGLTINDLSFSSIREQLAESLRMKMGKPGIEWYGWIDEVFPDFVIFYSGGKYYRFYYTLSKNGVKLTGEAEEVRRVTEYQTVAGSIIGNVSSEISTPSIEENQMDKKAKVALLIANSVGMFTEKDIDFLLNNKTEQQLDQLIALNKPATPPAPTPPAGTIPVTAPAPVANTGAQTVEQYIASAPAGMQEALRNMYNNELAQKQQLINNIMAAPGNTFSQEFLMLKPVPELQGIAALIQRPVAPTVNHGVPMFLGNAPVPSAPNGQAFQINEKPMPVRTIFDAPGKN